jgi:hypothetical protein
LRGPEGERFVRILHETLALVTSRVQHHAGRGTDRQRHDETIA